MELVFLHNPLKDYYNLSENHFLLGAHSGWLILDEEFLGTFELDINNINSPDILELDENNIIQPSNQSSNTSGIVRFRPHIYSRKNNLIFKAGISLNCLLTSSIIAIAALPTAFIESAEKTNGNIPPINKPAIITG